MPEIIRTPTALVQTTNGKRFYVFSGRTTVSTTETTMISINDIGERDILFKFQMGASDADTDPVLLKIKSNGVDIFKSLFSNTEQEYPYGHTETKLILPASTSLVITLQLGGGSNTVEFTIAAHGKYLSM